MKKTKQCKICGREFKQRTIGQATDSPTCERVYQAQKKEQKEQRAKDRQKIIKMGGRGAGKSVILVDRKEVEKKLDEVTRIHVKLRDCYLPCISCGASWSPEFEAGHFHTRGAHPKLKFNIKNIHAQCKKCNGSESGNKVGFKKGIAERYGAQALRELEKLPLTAQTKTNWEMCEDIKILSELNKQLRGSIKT